jgi:hypothetical protein
MKKLTIIGLLMLAFIGFNSCSEDDDLVFTAVSPEEGVVFTNTFLPEYVLTPQTAGNLAERFTWSDAYFDVPTPVTYELQKSLSGIFDDESILVGSTGGNELGVSVGQMLSYAAEAGLDNDPETEAPNSGQVYFRVRAYVGLNTDTEAYTPTITLNIVLPDIVEGGSGAGFEVSSWGVVGNGYNNWGAADGPLDGLFYTTSTAGVIVSYVNLLDGEIKFRENNDWGSNLGDDGSGSALVPDGANIPVSAGDYKITINTNDNTYTIEEFSYGVVGSAFNNWGNTPGVSDAKLYYDYTTDTFKANVKLFNGEFKIRMNNDWGTNYGDTGADGILDQNGDNIPVSEGHYLVTLNPNDLSYTIEEATVLGVTGSSYNNWGQDLWDHDDDPGTDDIPISDAGLTEIQPGVWFAENITLLTGEAKFRENNDWGTNYGDSGLDNILDQDGDNIPAAAGNYVISIDFNDLDGPKYRLGKRSD